MSWLLQGSDKQYTFIKEIALLGAIPSIDKHHAFGSGKLLTKLESGFSLLQENSTEADALRKKLSDEGVDVNKAVGQWLKVKGFISEQLPEKYAALTRTLTDLEADSKGVYPVTLPILDGKTISASEKISPLALSIDANADLRVFAQARPTDVPEGVTAVPLKHIVALAVSGQLAVDGKAVLPEYLQLEGSVANDAEVKWFFHNQKEHFYAQALASNLKQLCSPFKLADVAARLDLSECEPALAALTYKHKHQRSYGGKLSLHKAALPGLKLSTSFTGSIDYRASYTGEFEYSFLREEGKPTLKVRRANSDAERHQRNLMLSCDLAPLYTELKGLLFNLSDDAYAVLANLDEILSRDYSLKARLESVLEEKISDSDDRVLIQAALGLGGNPGELLATAILSEVETSTARWSESARDFTDQLLQQLTDRLKLGSELEQKLTELVSDEVSDALVSESERLTEKVAGLIQSDKINELVSALGRAGLAVNNFDGRIEQLLSPLREFLTKYQEKVQSLKSILNDAASTKLEAELTLSESTEASHALELELRFNEVEDPQTQALYSQLLMGNMERIASLMQQGGDLAGVEIVSGELTRILGYKEQVGLGVRLFGLELERQRSVERKTVYSANAKGDILVRSQQEVEASIRAGNESRTLGFINVFDLATAKETCSLSLTLSMSNKDARISEAEWVGFWSSLRDAQLLSRKTYNEQMVRFRELTKQGSVAGEMQFAFEVKSNEIHSLLGLDDDFGQIDTVKQQQRALLVAKEVATAAETDSFDKLSSSLFGRMQAFHACNTSLPTLNSIPEAILLYTETLTAEVDRIALAEEGYAVGQG